MPVSIVRLGAPANLPGWQAWAQFQQGSPEVKQQRQDIKHWLQVQADTPYTGSPTARQHWVTVQTPRPLPRYLVWQGLGSNAGASPRCQLPKTHQWCRPLWPLTGISSAGTTKPQAAQCPHLL